MAAAAGACFNAVIDGLCQSLVGSELKLELSSLGTPLIAASNAHQRFCFSL